MVHESTVTRPASRRRLSGLGPSSRSLSSVAQAALPEVPPLSLRVRNFLQKRKFNSRNDDRSAGRKFF